VSPPTYAQPHGNLLFHWEPPRKRRTAIAGFLLASAALHAFCFYLFQVVYPPAISLLPPPARVSLISPDTPEGRSLLNWVEAEDPALATQTQRPADARAFQLPKLAHVPFYLAVPPTLKQPPTHPPSPVTPSAMPPGPVPVPPPRQAAAAAVTPTALFFSDALGDLPVSHPEFAFRASIREAPQSARFRVAVDSTGLIRFSFLEQSSGDTALDEQARQYLVLSRFGRSDQPANMPRLRWATATFQFGTDVRMPPDPEQAP
jgi:hypothetical protein